MTDELKVWRVRGLRDLELQRAAGSRAAREAHLHGQFEIAIVARGAQELSYRRARHIAATGSVVVIPPGEVHSHTPLDDTLISRSFFPDLSSLVDASEFGRTGNHSPQFREVVIHDADLAGRIGALHRQLARPGSILARETNAVTAATLLVRRHAAGGRIEAFHPERDIVRRVQRHLHDRLDQNVTLGELTAMTALPAYALVRAFTRRVGMPPHAYHLQLRLDLAKRLLARGHAPARVAADAGFVDQSHLARHFRRWVGVTPGAYREAVLP